MLRTFQFLTLGTALGLLLGACSDDAGSTGDATTQTLTLSLSGLTDLGDDFVYEGWLIVDGAPISSGRFSLVDGQSTYDFEVDAIQADGASTFVLTIEPAVGDDPAPAATHVLAGDLSGGAASLTVGHAAALATDFATGAGTFILETPTTADVADDYNQGVWFVDPSDGSGTLELPVLPAGWAYEGWVVGADGPISTGRFTDTNAADSDGAGDGAGPDGFPMVPGQDFIDPGQVLTDFTVVLTVEPEPDNSPAPSDLKPLGGMISDAGAGVAQDLDIQPIEPLPSGTVAIE